MTKEINITLVVYSDNILLTKQYNNRKTQSFKLERSSDQTVCFFHSEVGYSYLFEFLTEE